MSAEAWEYETCGEWTFRVAPCLRLGGWKSEAKRGGFVAQDIFHEPGDCWFEFGRSREEALAKLKAEVLS